MESYDYYKELTTPPNSNSTYNEYDNEYEDKAVIVIAVTLSSVFLFVIVCCCITLRFSKWIDRAINDSFEGSDIEYGERVLRRMEEEKKKKTDDPEVRRAKLFKSFDRNNVTMVSIDCTIIYFTSTHNLWYCPSFIYF